MRKIYKISCGFFVWLLTLDNSAFGAVGHKGTSNVFEAHIQYDMNTIVSCFSEVEPNTSADGVNAGDLKNCMGWIMDMEQSKNICFNTYGGPTDGAHKCAYF
jgi:hypothetical protein